MTDKEAVEVFQQLLDQCTGAGFFKSVQTVYQVNEAFALLKQCAADKQVLQEKVFQLQQEKNGQDPAAIT